MEAVLEPIARSTQRVATATAALDALAEDSFDLITLDIGLPDLNGVELLPHIRAMTTTPVIIVSALGQSATVVAALGAGADDYVVKPVRPAELRARVQAVTRRRPTGAPIVDRYLDADIAIDFSRSVVLTGRKSVTLSSTERRLLHELVQHRGGVLTHDYLLRTVWGAGYGDDIQNLHVFIGYLRRKLDVPGKASGYIRTHRGIGYEFVPRAEATSEEHSD